MSSCAEKAQSRPLLNREVIGKRADSRPVRVVQFGGGVFLRGFADWMIDAMNRHDLFNGSVALVQSVDQKRSEQLRAQDGLYTVRLSGPEQSVMTDASHVVDVFSTWLSPQHDFTAFLRLAENPDWRYMISNTTENGLVWLDGDFPRQRAADSFPGRLTQLLYHRYRFFQAEPDRGVVCLPCELIPENGTQLYQLVLRHAQRWQLPASFTDWLRRACVFHNTLVDRIVAGYPSDPDKA
ncbi:MAG: tagaturonate reductase, partial [Clostridia bacterium]|nr:tagaturonate reductase [Clostridia bacterium]